MFSPGLSLEFSMNNLLSYYGLVDAKIRASDKDLPVPSSFAHYPRIFSKFKQFTPLSLFRAQVSQLEADLA